MKTKNVGVAVDDWKVPRFQRELKKLGFETEVRPGPVKNVSILLVPSVPVARVHDIHLLCERVQRELNSRN